MSRYGTLNHTILSFCISAQIVIRRPVQINPFNVFLEDISCTYPLYYIIIYVYAYVYGCVYARVCVRVFDGVVHLADVTEISPKWK